MLLRTGVYELLRKTNTNANFGEFKKSLQRCPLNLLYILYVKIAVSSIGPHQSYEFLSMVWMIVVITKININEMF